MHSYQNPHDPQSDTCSHEAMTPGEKYIHHRSLIIPWYSWYSLIPYIHKIYGLRRYVSTILLLRNVWEKNTHLQNLSPTHVYNKSHDPIVPTITPHSKFRNPSHKTNHEQPGDILQLTHLRFKALFFIQKVRGFIKQFTTAILIAKSRSFGCPQLQLWSY